MKSTPELANTVYEILSEVVKTDADTVDHVIEEFLFQAARALRSGDTVHLKYIGTISIDRKNQTLLIEPCQQILQPLEVKS